MEKWFHFYLNGSGYYDPFIFQNETSAKSNITAMDIIRMWIGCGYEVLSWPFMICKWSRIRVSRMGSFLVSNWNFFKRVSLIGKFDGTKWKWWIKLFSVNPGLEWFKWDRLRMSKTSISLPREYWSLNLYFWRRRKNFWIPGGQEILDSLKIDFNGFWSLVIINLSTYKYS